jgi:hypothetical protein
MQETESRCSQLSKALNKEPEQHEERQQMKLSKHRLDERESSTMKTKALCHPQNLEH